MAKKIVLDDAQLSRIAISNAANEKNIIPVVPAMKSGDSFSASFRGRSGRHIEDELMDDKAIDVTAEEATPDIVVSDSEQSILLAKTDVSLPSTPNTTPVTVVQKGVDLFGSNSGNWWAGGLGLATVGTGVGFALSRNDSTTNNSVSAISDSNVTANSVAENATTGTVVGITALATDAGDTISYSLSDNAGGRFAIDATTGVITVADGTLLDYESASSHAVTVLATSSDGSTSSQQFTVNLSNVNDNPVSAISDSNVANNSVDENAATGTVVGITALATDADAGTTISYSLSDNAGGRYAIDATTGVITVADGTLLDFETATSHDVTVLATSSDGSTNSQVFTIDLSNVNDPVSTIKDSNVAADTVVENAINGTVVGITALATDADLGATISYSLSDNAGGRFAIDAVSGVITVADGALLDFESATSHAVTVLATSSDGSTNSQQFTIDLSNVNDNPVSAISDSNVAADTVVENAVNGTVVGITVLATDTDAGATLSYSLSDNAGGRFAIDAVSGVITVADGTLLDFETATNHDVTVLVTSSDGSTNSQQFTIDLSNANDSQVSAISDSNVAADTVVENAVNGMVVGITALATDADADTTLSYSLSDNAGGRFAIDATTGVITVADGTLLDYESATSHAVTVLATSSDGSTSSQQFTIDLSNVNDNLVSAISDSNVAADTVVENAVNGMVVGITALATDAEAGATISFSLSDNAGGRFAIDATSGVITVADGTLLDYESASSHAVTVLVTSSDGSTNSQQFTIDLSNANDSQVSAISDSNVAADTVVENAVNGTVVGITVLATDTDAGATLSYSLSDNAGGRFAIDATTGVITVADGTLLDYESATSHAVTVLATSSDGSTSSQQFTIDLSNVNDSPVSAISDSDVAGNFVAENAAIGTVVGITALATDADADTTISYSLSDNAGGRFAIDATTGVITVADGTLLDYESATSHAVTVLATSSDGSTSSQQFTVNLGNVNDSPVSTISDSNVADNSVDENAANGTVVGITALATDADAGATISYSLTDSAGGRFAIDATSGVITVADGTLLDYESATSHAVTVLATSSDGSTSSQQFTVNVGNVNDNLVSAISDSDVAGNSVAENAVNGTVVGITVLATDADADTTISYSFSDNAGGRFAIDATTGVVTVADGTLLDFETVTSHDVTVLATSSDGSTNSQQFTINVINDDEAPVISSNSGGASATVNVAENQSAVTTVTSTDVDAGDGKTFSLTGGADELLFTIDPDTGVLTFVAAPNFEAPTDAGANNIYDVKVTVTDTAGLSDVQDLAITVTDAYETVVVESTGAWIDLNANGVRDVEDTLQADFTPGSGNIDLAANPVTIHFNDAPGNPLNLAGFGSDDLIEIDAQAFIDNGHNALNILAIPNIITLDDFSAYTSGSSNSNSYSFVYNTLTRIGSGSGTSYANSNRYSGVSGSLNATIGLRLLDRSLATRTLMYFSSSPSAGTNVQLASGLPTDMLLQDVVDFVNLPVQQDPVNVVVDDQAGNVATFIDANANGVRDSGEDTLALLGQTQADVDAFNAVAGTNYGSQAVDLASEQVSIHYNDLPTEAWVPDMTGFSGNDRIEIDVAAMLNNITVNDTASLNNQPTRTMGSQTQFFAGVSGVSSGNAAVYLSGGNLKFGHRVTTTSFTGSTTVNNTHYTATGTLQGVIASNAGTIGNNFQHVVFVTSIE